MNIPLSVVEKGLVSEYVSLTNAINKYYHVNYSLSSRMRKIQGEIRILGSELRNPNVYIPDELVTNLMNNLTLYQTLRKDYKHYDNTCKVIQKKLDGMV